jgi:hypothetical protein
MSNVANTQAMLRSHHMNKACQGLQMSSPNTYSLDKSDTKNDDNGLLVMKKGAKWHTYTGF